VTSNVLKNTALWCLVAIGLFGVVKVSYLEITDAASCPNFAGIPICYVVTVGYALMFLSLLLSQKRSWKRLFLGGWSITFLIALIGTLLETINGHTCPIGFGWLPLCYVSLALCLVILGLFVAIKKPTPSTN